MPNDYFRFKQFTISQDRCAMKVCTDACLFGAWVADSLTITAHRVLDIGTGTGLLALMYAQKNPAAVIDAVEMDDASAEQARENFEAAPWKERLNLYNVPIQEFILKTSTRYDCIISNPPFYENELKSENQKRNLALHSSELNLEALISAVDRVLANDGTFFVLLPYYRTKYFDELAAKEKLFIHKKIHVRQTPRHNYFRSMLQLTKNAGVAEESGIIIMDEKNEYTAGFSNLLLDYYLYL